MTKLLEKDTSFHLDEECHKSFHLLIQRLIDAQIMRSPDWNLSFELMCDQVTE